ncbi:MAG: DNRLRE domain-containing protein [candidate division Zixibacteria bacterium]|nr:DNRLRE domain-containing protein [candidate division Zixibacteria bacterium]
MFKSTGLLILSLILIIGLIGCGNEPDLLTSPDMSSLHSLAAGLAVPEGATLESAEFVVYVVRATGQPINIHRINAPWEEMTVTWNNFGGAYESEVVTTFTPTEVGWHEIDLTGLVGSWMDGTYENYGFLMDQVEETYPRTIYHSRESDRYNPYLRVCYSVNGETLCDSVLAMADAYIWQIIPNTNRGAEWRLYTGWEDETDLEKQSLVKFDLEVAPPQQEGCSRTIGYWKTHAGFGPQADMVSAYLPIWLGTEGGAKSLAVTDAATAVNVLKMKTYGSNSNGITKLYAQLLGTKLSIASGASDVDVADAIAEADAFLADHDYTNWKKLSGEEKDMVLDLKTMFDDYNNGIIGPGHCDD